MKVLLFLCFLIVFPFAIVGQDGFQFEKGINKVTIPFQTINNLIFIPIKVNGIELHFLLDTGVEETILFSMEDKKEVNFYNVEKISLRGLGSDHSIEGLKSTSNTLDVKELKSSNHWLYIVLDQNFNLSSHVGIPVNGIIGYNFFKNNLVEVNYSKKRIIVYADNERNRVNIGKRFAPVPITIEGFKPYLLGNVTIDAVEKPAKLLLDIGNSDAIWLFENKENGVTVPIKNFEDFLGQGFSGDVEGKRAQISKFSFSKFDFKKPIVSFPDSSSTRNVKMVQDRAGSVGAEILRRFNLVFDYSRKQLFVKKNGNFDSPFKYNKSGVELQHYGLQWVQETVALETVPKGTIVINDGELSRGNFKYKFVLKPIYLVAHVRKNSPAAISGLKKGDIIVSINNRSGHDFSLEKINELLKSEEEDWINLEVERESKILRFKFQLHNVL